MKRTSFALAIVAIAACGLSAASASAADPTIALRTAENFGVLAGSSVSSTGLTVVTGDLGVSPGTPPSVVGFPVGVVNGTIHAADQTAAQAQTDLTAAYDAATNAPCDDVIAGDLNGLTLTPGVYCAGAAIAITGTLTLDLGGDPNAFFLFKINAALNPAANAVVRVIDTGAGNETCAPNAFWQVAGAVTLGANSSFTGDLLANAAISAGASATLSGRALSRTGIVTMAANAVSACASPTADLSVNAGGSPHSVAPGADVTYAIAATNGGAFDAADATMTATLPSDLSFESVSTPAGWSCTTPAVGAAGAMTCTKARFAVGSVTFSLTAKVAAGITADKIVSLAVVVSSSTNDLDSADLTTTVDTNVDAPDPIVTPTPNVDAPDPIVTPTANVGAPDPIVTPTAGELGVAVRSPASCTSRRRFTVHLSRKPGAARGAVVTNAILVDPKRRTLRTLKVDRTSVDVDMRRMAMGQVILRITAKLRSGKTARISRSFQTCWPTAA
jgi:uncharacterized repeat protein (TIGR01451 family)